MSRTLAPLAGWLCGCGLIAAALAAFISEQWLGGALFLQAGGGLCAWADWMQVDVLRGRES